VESKLVAALASGLRRAHKLRQIPAIAKEAGLSESTVLKVKSGSTQNVYAPNLERLWVALYERGHVPAEFVFPVDNSMAETPENTAA